MAYPDSAVIFNDPFDPNEVLEYVAAGSGTLLEDGETIDPAFGRWSLALLAESVAAGLEIIEGDPDYSDPELINGNTEIRFWVRMDPDALDDPVFLAGVLLPMEMTFWTTSSPARRRQRTLVLRVVEQ
jgi:hypothetical protein